MGSLPLASPGKPHTGGCCLLCLVPQSCPTLCDPMDCSPCQAPLSMGILQARILEWVAMPSSGGSSQLRDWTQVSCIAGGFFTIWATREAPSTGDYPQVKHEIPTYTHKPEITKYSHCSSPGPSSTTAKVHTSTEILIFIIPSQMDENLSKIKGRGRVFENLTRHFYGGHLRKTEIQPLHVHHQSMCALTL